MPKLPTGTVTFLFTDIEGSTRLWEQHPEAMRGALARHDALAVSLADRHAGVLVRSRGEGDSLFLVFARASDAVAAACAFQQALVSETWPPPVSLRVRMALHTGEADLRDGGYYGSEVNRCARLRAVAHGGQVLLSRTTFDLVRDVLPEGVSLRDLGEQRLRDLTRPEQVFQLHHPDLPGEFSPLHTLDLHPHNLPVQPTPLLGREREIEEARALLRRSDVRLLTLTGPGGTGKTRLGLQLAAELLDDFADGAFVVALAPIHDAGLVLSTIAQTLEVREAGGTSLLETLSGYLRDKQLLLVLDNFEQVIPAAPHVAELLAAAPGLKVLVTSREMLHLRGEQEFPVPPLALPDPKHLPPSGALSQYAAVELFIQRATNVKPDFAVTNENAPAVAEICCRLDGLPMAIELAAARIRLFPPRALLSRLETRLKLLVGGARDLPARQQTLWDTIAWSYDLLSVGEKQLFRRLAVFVGGCTIEAAEAVCQPGDSSSEEYPPLEMEVLEGIAALVEKSLLRQEEGRDGEPHFSMLETVREYARECLAASGEAPGAMAQHLSYFLALAQRSAVDGPEQGEWLERLEREHDNFRAALDWSAGDDEGDVGLKLTAALARFWEHRGHLSEGRRRLTAALAHPRAAEPTALRGDLLNQAGNIASWQGDLAVGRALHEENLQIWRAHGDRAGVACVLHNLAIIMGGLGEYAQARQMFEEALAINRDRGDRHAEASDLDWFGLFLVGQGEDETAQSMFQQALKIARELRDTREVAIALEGLGVVALRSADYTTAQALFEEALALNRGQRMRGYEAHNLSSLGTVALHRADYPTARALLAQALEIQQEIGTRGGVATSLRMFARLAVLQGQPGRAARLFGAAEALGEAIGNTLAPAAQQEYDRSVAGARTALGEQSFVMAWAEGRAMPLEQAIAYALEDA
jgi:predicted ATPase/class 3 adenylate cyclase/Tfp pilus assembly protein PilF